MPQSAKLDNVEVINVCELATEWHKTFHLYVVDLVVVIVIISIPNAIV